MAVKGHFYSLVEPQHGGEINAAVAPAENGVFDGAVQIGAEINGRRGIGVQLRNGCGGFQKGLTHIVYRGVIGGADLQHDAAAAQGGIIGDPFGGDAGVGQHHGLVVLCVQLGIHQADLVHISGHAGNLHIVAQGNGAGRKQHHAAGHIGKHTLHGQGDGQRSHAEQGHQGGGGNAQMLGHDDDQDNIGQHPQAGDHEPLQPLVQLGVFEHPPDAVQHKLDGDQPRQQQEQGGEHGFQGQIA